MKATDSLESWLNQHIGTEKFRPGLDRLVPIFKPFIVEFKRRNIRIITIAGTNGKGECCFSLNHLFRADNKSVAVWTSPHILSVCERFLFNGELLAQDSLLVAFKEHQGLSQKLSYYEFLFYIFCDQVLKNKSAIENVILEVGLGGRLDAVNLFDADIMGVTSISRDHQEFLGTSLKGILREKLGITRQNKPVIVNLEAENLRLYAQEYCQANYIPLFHLKDFVEGIDEFNYSQHNRLLALKTYQFFNDDQSKDHLLNVNDLDHFQNMQLKARFESRIIHGSTYLFNGAHNVDGMRKLRDFCLDQKFHFDLVLYGPSSRKENELIAMLKVLKSAKCLYNELKLTTFEGHARSCTVHELERLNSDLAIVNWKDEIENKIDKGSTVLVTGSYYFIGEIQKHFFQ